MCAQLRNAIAASRHCWNIPSRDTLHPSSGQSPAYYSPKALSLQRNEDTKSLTAAEGRLVVRPAELLDDEVRWLIRKHRDALIELIQAEPSKGIEADEAHFHWRVRFIDFALDTFHHPYATRADVLRKYPDALTAEPLPEPPRREWTAEEDADWQAAWG